MASVFDKIKSAIRSHTSNSAVSGAFYQTVENAMLGHVQNGGNPKDIDDVGATFSRALENTGSLPPKLRKQVLDTKVQELAQALEARRK